MVVERGQIARLHWGLIGCVLIIAALGVWNLASASRTEASALWLAQLRALGVGVVLVTLSLLFDYKILRSIAWPVYLVTVVLLVTVHYHGRNIMGAQRWLQVGPLNIQPSEFAKIAVILMLARHFGEHPPPEKVIRRQSAGEKLGRWWARLRGDWAARRNRIATAPPRLRPGRVERVTGYRLRELVWPSVLLFLPVVIVVKQPDLGTGLVTAAIGGSMILFAGLTLPTLGTIGASGLVLSVVAWFKVLKPYQKARVLTFLDPELDAKGAGYHAIQSLIAVGSGRGWGKGWGNGTQNQLSFLPEQHTDFAFPVWAEEHGFAGALMVVVLYLFLVLCAVDIAAKARDRFGAFLALGVAGLFFWHAFINIGMVIGLLPVVGVPLLLVSYGGSSAVLTMLGVGVLLNVSLRRHIMTS